MIALSYFYSYTMHKGHFIEKKGQLQTEGINEGRNENRDFEIEFKDA